MISNKLYIIILAIAAIACVNATHQVGKFYPDYFILYVCAVTIIFAIQYAIQYYMQKKLGKKYYWVNLFVILILMAYFYVEVMR
jgi:hypothetical protein